MSYVVDMENNPTVDSAAADSEEKQHRVEANNILSKEIELSSSAWTVLKRRYLRKDQDGNVAETPAEMFLRVARAIAKADLLYNPECDLEATERAFFQVLSDLLFLPNSPTLMNAGRELGQLSACFVLPIEDSMASIFDTIKDTAIIHKSGGGTGFSFSRIRPKNDVVKSTSGISSGPISFMTVFDAATETIKQGGTRRGANMGILRIDHPDIEEFTVAKEDNSKLNNFNISIAISDDFMRAYKEDAVWNLVSPRTGDIVKKVSARSLFKRIITMAWKNGEPGVIFIDRINAANPTPEIGQIESTNPCGEQPLLPYESCNLGSINLSLMVKSNEGKREIDCDRLRRTIHTAVHFLDNVIDVNKYPLSKIEQMTKANRKIGLGVMGYADMLIKLRIPYNSKKALETAEFLMSFLQKEAQHASEILARTRGAFPNFVNSTYARRNEPEVRNATVTTIAPTGTISIIGGCSSGIEPLFALAFSRNVLDNDSLVEINPLLESVARKEGFYCPALMEHVKRTGTLKDYTKVASEYKQIFATAHEISPEWHVKMQSAFQKYCDNAVSKTVNFPREATVEDVQKVYELAYGIGCKGVTIYRDGSRDRQVLVKGHDTKEAKTPAKRERPSMLCGKSIEMKTGCGPLYVTINEDEHGLFELFNTMGKAGGCAASQSEAIGRLVSLAWRSGVDADAIVKQLIGITCHKHVGFGRNKILSCPDAIAKAILLYKNPQEKFARVSYTKGSGACPKCGGAVEPDGGCSVCRHCGYTECS
jgi:ribonucleoside-diphosphate reductase alpha chain